MSKPTDSCPCCFYHQQFDALSDATEHIRRAGQSSTRLSPCVLPKWRCSYAHKSKPSLRSSCAECAACAIYLSWYGEVIYCSLFYLFFNQLTHEKQNHILIIFFRYFRVVYIVISASLVFTGPSYIEAARLLVPPMCCVWVYKPIKWRSELRCNGSHELRTGTGISVIVIVFACRKNFYGCTRPGLCKIWGIWKLPNRSCFTLCPLSEHPATSRVYGCMRCEFQPSTVGLCHPLSGCKKWGKCTIRITSNTNSSAIYFIFLT